MKRAFLFFLLLSLNSIHGLSQTWNWAKEESMCGDYFGFGNSICSDDSGNVYYAVDGLTGSISLSKFNNTGSFIWTNTAKHYSYAST